MTPGGDIAELVAIWFALGAIYGCIVGPMLRKALTEPVDDAGHRLSHRDGFLAPVPFFHAVGDNDA